MTWLKSRPDWQLLGVLTLMLIAFKAWLTAAAGFELHYDEAQYWEWSQHLDWSYYSKGPLVAWLIALAEYLFGHGEWQVRLFAWLTHGIFLVLIFVLTRQVWGSPSAAWWATSITLTTPLYFTLGLVMTTDIFLFTFWTWGLWAACRALIQEQPRAWYELGAAVGIGALAKLSIGLLPAAIGLLTLIIPQYRRHLLRPHVWAGLGLMLICMSPLLLWNYHHDWVMFRHELGHVGQDEWSWIRLIEFLLGQWAALSPLVAILAIAVLAHYPHMLQQRFIWIISLLCLGFFLIKAGGAKVQLNWPAPVYIGFVVLFAGAIPNFTDAQRRWLISGIFISLALMAVAYFPHYFGLPAKLDPFKVVKIWRQPINAISTMAPRADFILTDKYELAGELAFYWPQGLPVYITGSAARRFNQHDLWPAIDREAGRDAIFISTKPNPPAELTQAFRQCVMPQTLAVHAYDGSVLRTLYVTPCSDYVSIIWPKPQFY